MPQIGYAHRPVALGRQGMVAAAHPLATLAGIETLKSGGRAADGAVAVNGVLAVTQPNLGVLGGALFCLSYEAAPRRGPSRNAGARPGPGASADDPARRGLPRLPVVGPPTVSVPGCVRAWAMLLERFGTRPLGELLGPAINAADGFPISALVSEAIGEFTSVTSDAEWRRVFAPDGRAPALGELFAQPELARTLRALAAEGPDLFYTGSVGQAIARRLERDGFLTAEDLAAHTGEGGEPISTTYRGVRVFETPPPTQGLAALLALNLLEGFPLATLTVHSVEHLHLLLEMVKLAYADRDRWIGDPAHARLPVDALLSKAYAARRRAQFDPEKAQSFAFEIGRAHV